MLPEGADDAGNDTKVILAPNRGVETEKVCVLVVSTAPQGDRARNLILDSASDRPRQLVDVPSLIYGSVKRGHATHSGTTN